MNISQLPRGFSSIKSTNIDTFLIHIHNLYQTYKKYLFFPDIYFSRVLMDSNKTKNLQTC